ncbi:nitrilase family protein [Flavihumibacter fluvii]|uniref:nitrilase family protein n=1 Tax=Flavihumibacter fluvii TaxID=2838157 RepID=UPI001BDE7BCC|nr:nitrilase family protein [Flavihumibacter fluvii]ULQ51672.1 nitrilase family protein [Flavihumibacter fluvii]
MSSLTITTIQTDLSWEDKPANLAMFDRKIRAITERTEIVLLPEMFSTGFSMQPEKFAETMDGPTVSWMKQLSAEKKVILAGSLIIEAAGKYYNRLVWMLPNGQHGFYDKRHLFAFAGEDQCYTAGNRRLIASVKGWKIQLQVCYDLRFPVWARQSPAAGSHLPGIKQREEGGENTPEYDVLINVANWPERRNHAWKTLLAARAIENQCYVAGVNRVGTDGLGNYHSGDTMVIGPMGNILYQKAHEEDIHTITLQKPDLDEVRGKLPFLRDADSFTIIKEEPS